MNRSTRVRVAVPRCTWICCGLLLLATHTSGCTALLWQWGAHDRAAREVVGHSRAAAEDRIHVREREPEAAPEEGSTAQYWVVRVPSDWTGGAIETFPLESGGELLVLAPRLRAEVSTEPACAEEDLSPLDSIELAAALVPVAPAWGVKGQLLHDPTRCGGKVPYAVLRSWGPEGHIAIEVFGYHPEKLRWVLLTHPIDLGPSEDRLWQAVALTPFVLTLDLAVLALVTIGAGVTQAPIAGDGMLAGAGAGAFPLPSTERCGPIEGPLGGRPGTPVGATQP